MKPGRDWWLLTGLYLALASGIAMERGEPLWPTGALFALMATYCGTRAK